MVRARDETLLACLLGAAVLSHMAGDAPNPPFLCSLFRQDPVPEEPCARRSSEEAEAHRWVLQGKGSGECRAALLPEGSGPPPAMGFPCWTVLTPLIGKDGPSQTPPRLTGEVETGCCLLPGSLAVFSPQTLCTGLVPHSVKALSLTCPKCGFYFYIILYDSGIEQGEWHN